MGRSHKHKKHNSKVFSDCKYRKKREHKIVHLISDLHLEYRDVTGRSNNLKYPTYGEANQQLLRKSPAAYEDGLSEPNGSDRPSARVISNEIFNQEHPIPSPEGASAYFWLWGQFVDHDIDLTPGADPAESFPIPVPVNDPYFDPEGKGDVVIPFDRSTYDPDSGITSPRQQLNVITSFLDGSNIYCSDANRLKYCRKFKGGELLTSEGEMLPYNNGSVDNAGGNGTGLYVAGDVRANENLALTSLHTLWVREHNFWCRKLKHYNPCWKDEKLFQTAKTIVEAELQIITYREFLPLLLSSKFEKYRGYNCETDPQIANEFSTAGYRLGHSLVGPKFKRLDGCWKPIWAGNLQLKDAFFSPWKLTNEGGIDPILRGFAKTLSEKLDAKVIDDLRNFLFGEPGQGGLDLVSLNIQRGRDHGLSDYNTARESYGLSRVSDFSDITADTELQDKLEELYGNVDNIDLWVGCLVEDPKKHSMLGELCHEIVREQFSRLRDGDRFWYEKRFPKKLRYLLKKTKLSDVILRNTDIDSIQKYVMLKR